ncbi:MAG: TIGR04283 family arsenosugar biosynthesis glycosyltransferase [Myxacorys chilensis ATA2-1-KO14]|jgi:rSAM/selenodomain-associated transferase 2|nr:TIGR04283 family arsenosugar biosynthesis glycosyltransferase [Myxacorys chilensis ATA2-1-KO14]
MLPKISVIIPVLNEAEYLSKTLALLSMAANVELIVVDGGSQDATILVAQTADAQVISSTPGRAVQMNLGAAIASGDILLFLHADTRLPPKFDTMIRETLAYSIAGAFELKINIPSVGVRLVEWGTNLRSRYLQLPYGDQAIFLKKSVFQAVGGFSALPIMEDFEFVQRLKHHGNIQIVRASVLTSGRRWQTLGVVRTTLINQFIIGAYLLGVSPERLRQWYRSGMRRRKV